MRKRSRRGGTSETRTSVRTPPRPKAVSKKRTWGEFFNQYKYTIATAAAATAAAAALVKAAAKKKADDAALNGDEIPDVEGDDALEADDLADETDDIEVEVEVEDDKGEGDR